MSELSAEITEKTSVEPMRDFGNTVGFDELPDARGLAVSNLPGEGFVAGVLRIMPRV